MHTIAQVNEIIREEAKRLNIKDVTIKYNTSTSAFGTCYAKRRHIEFSKVLFATQPIENIRDTVLHEFAHLLAFERHGARQKHNHNWKAICIEIGAKPLRCGKTIDVPLYNIICPKHGKIGESIVAMRNRACKSCLEKVSFRRKAEVVLK